MPDATQGMRRFWDAAASSNAAWYVDTSISYDDPDMDAFWQTGTVIAGIAMDGPVAPKARGVAVEIGPGLGRILRSLVRDHGFERAIGVDISPEMVSRARELVADERISFEVGSGASLAPVEDGVADLVLSFTVFQHIPSVAVIEEYIAEAGRVLRSGGVFAFQWNNLPGQRRWALRRSLLSAMQRTGIRPERYRRNAPEFLGSRVSLRRITAALERAGLEIGGTKDAGTLFAWAWASKP
jgi:SAM-dependent methyltransferase